MSYTDKLGKKPKLKISGLDSMPADVVIKMSESELAIKAVIRHGLKSHFNDGDKYDINMEEYLEASSDIEDSHKTVYAGGTTSNMMHNIVSILGTDNVSATIVSPSSVKKNGNAVRDAAEKSGIHVLPDLPTSSARKLTTPVHYIFANDLSEDKIAKLEKEYGKELPFLRDNTKFILKYDGNSLELKQELRGNESDFDRELKQEARSSDLFFLPAGNTQKFSQRIFDLTHKCTSNSDTKSIFLLPTNSNITAEEAVSYYKAFKSATVILGNKQELVNTLKAFSEHIPDFPVQGEITKDIAMEFLGEEVNKKAKSGKTVVYSMSDDLEPATILYASNKIYEKKDVPIIKGPALCSLGAGDTTSSFIVAGILKGYSPEDSVKIAMHGANAVINQYAAQLPGPSEVFEKAAKEMNITPSENPFIQFNSVGIAA